jgi:TPR repeat protein
MIPGKWKLRRFGPASRVESAVLALLAAFPFLALPLVARPQAQSEPQDISDLRKAAAQGDAQKQFELGSRYYTGKGVAKDHAEAMRWYCKAAEEGHPGKQFHRWASRTGLMETTLYHALAR